MGFEKQLDLLDEFEKAGERPDSQKPLDETEERIKKMKAWADKLPKTTPESPRQLSPEEEAYWDKVFPKGGNVLEKKMASARPEPFIRKRRADKEDEIIDYKSRQYKD